MKWGAFTAGGSDNLSQVFAGCHDLGEQPSGGFCPLFMNAPVKCIHARLLL